MERSEGFQIKIKILKIDEIIGFLSNIDSLVSSRKFAVYKLHYFFAIDNNVFQ